MFGGGDVMRYKFIRFPGGKSKAVTLSYDDGCMEDIRFADRITDAGLKCTFNLNSDDLRKNNLTKEEIEEHILSKGHEVAVHGALHRALGSQSVVEGIKDVLDCRVELENRYKRIIKGMAYPDSGINFMANGTSYEMIKDYLTELGIVYARTLGGDNNLFRLPADWHAWMPTAHHDNSELFDMIDEFVKLDAESIKIARRDAKLFYLWGHSFEFERNSNWDRLDKICDTLAGHDDIWYATNIEVYDYVNAYNSLVWSADNSLVYNPTLFEIWFTTDVGNYKISPGETVEVKKTYKLY